MKAWVWKGVDRIELETDYPDPVAKPGWVVLKVCAAGVCSTDVSIIRGRFGAWDPPGVLCHEICGEVAELGPGAKGVKVGDRVVVETSVGCGICVKCRTGNKHLCAEAGEIGFPPFDGGYAEYVAVPDNCCRKMPSVMTDEQGAILEASICPFGAIYRNPPPLGATVLVQGVGVAGLSFIQAVKCHGAGKVIAAGRNLSRLDNARRFGADIVVNTKEQDLDAIVRAETDGRGVDLSIDAAGAAVTFANALRLCAAGGVVNLYGLPAAGTKMELPTDEVIFRQLTIRGGTNNELAWVPLMDLIARGKFNNADMVTHRFGFEELPAAIELVDKHPDGLIKAVLNLNN